jgi:hypothetical protein
VLEKEPILLPLNTPIVNTTIQRATQLQVTSMHDLDDFVQAVDVYIDFSVTSTGARPQVLRALAYGTPAMYPDVGLVSPYVCDSCFPYQPGHWSSVIHEVQRLKEGKLKCNPDCSAAAAAYANGILNEDFVLPLAERIFRSLKQ